MSDTIRKICAEPGCREYAGWSLCDQHRFWSKVNKTNSCWLWTGKDNAKGYGAYAVGRRSLGDFRYVSAHRYAYELLVGAVPDGLQLDHLCRTKRCVNPAHMEPVTPSENKRRWARLITHCPHGHAYTPENTRLLNGCRNCKACAIRRQRDRRARRLEAAS